MRAQAHSQSGGTVGEPELWAPDLDQLLTLHVTVALSLFLSGPWFTIGHGQGGDWIGSEFNKVLYAYGMHAAGVMYQVLCILG